MPLTREVDLFFTEKRARKNETRRRKKWAEVLAKRQHEQSIDATFGPTSKIIQMIANEYRNDVTARKGRAELVVPKTFSIIDEPGTAIAAIGEFAKTVHQNRIRSVFINHWNLSNFDLAANGLLDVVAVEFKTEAARTRRRLRWQGRYPKEKHIQRFIRAMGIVKHLGLEHEYPKPEEEADLILFDERARHYFQNTQPNRADRKTQTVTRFADHVDRCLQTNGRTLTQEARHKLCVYTGEILDNAEEHAEMVDWTIQGYLDTSLPTPICEIAIFNFGTTMAASLQKLHPESYTWKQIAPYISQHTRFRLFGSTWSEENLLTLIALQGHVSCKNNSPVDTRGNGTVDLIEFFQKVHVECSAGDSSIKPQMAILSGGTFILFDGTYKLTERAGGGKIITFNSDNDLNNRPDPNYVHGLKGYNYPGTVISVRFPLTTQSTRPLASSSDGSKLR